MSKERVNTLISDGWIEYSLKSGEFYYSSAEIAESVDSILFPLRKYNDLNPFWARNDNESTRHWISERYFEQLKDYYGLGKNDLLPPNAWENSPLADASPDTGFFYQHGAGFIISKLWLCKMDSGDCVFIFSRNGKTEALKIAEDLKKQNAIGAISLNEILNFWWKLQSS